MIEPDHPRLSIVRQCGPVALSRSSFYSRPVGENSENLALMRLIDEQFLEAPWYGARQMARHLRRQGHVVGRKRVRRLMATMGLAAVYQRPRTTVPQPGHRIWPYLLRDLAIDRPDQVWCADITYIPMRRGFLYLVAVMDWVSRKVLAWRLSNTLDAEFCIDALEEALARHGRPEIFNTDQGRGQPVHQPALHRRLDRGRRPGVDGRARPLDGQRVHRAALWRSMKDEGVYLHAFETGSEARAGLDRWITSYNTDRPHSALGGRTPAEAHAGLPDGIGLAA